MLSSKYKVGLLKEFNKAIRNSTYYRGRSNIKEGSNVHGITTASWLELPLKKDILQAMNDRRLVNFEYVVKGRKRFICLDKGLFNCKSIAGGDRIFKELGFHVCDEEVFWLAQNDSGGCSGGQLQLVKTGLSDKYFVQVVALY